MLDRVKRVLVDSYIGAIALGYLLAEAVLSFVNIFEAPVAAWAGRKVFPQTITPGVTLSAKSPLNLSIPQLVAFLVLIVVWYVLLRWLYLGPSGEAKAEQQAPTLDMPETDS